MAIGKHPATAQTRVAAGDIVPDARILVVEDDDVVRSLHEAALSRAGYGTQGAVDGAEALELLATGDFDLVLTDRQMPRLDGCGLVRALRRAGSRIPVMMLSGSLADGAELPEDVRGEIAVAMAKPVGTHEILAGIARALGRGRAEAKTKRGAEGAAKTGVHS